MGGPAGSLAEVMIDCTVAPKNTEIGDLFEVAGRYFVVDQVPPGCDLRVGPTEASSLGRMQRLAPGDVLEVLGSQIPSFRAYWTTTEAGAPTGGALADEQRYARLSRMDGLIVRLTPRRVAVYPQAVPGGWLGIAVMDGSTLQLTAIATPAAPAAAVDEVRLTADVGNAGNVIVGFTNAGTGYRLRAGGELPLRVDDLQRIWLTGAAGDVVSGYAPFKVGR